jgi:hypothetical protein
MQKIIALILLIFAQFGFTELVEKRCRLNDPVRFRNYNFEGIDPDLMVWESNRFHVSLCEPISREKILEKCSTDKVDDVFFFNVVEPEYKNCLIFTREDISLSYNENFSN